jgi:transposase
MVSSSSRAALRTTDPPFLELLGDLEGEARIAIEATYGWEWAAELFEDAGYEFHLAHPKGTKAIAAARVKNDAVDAQTLAQLLCAGLLPEAYAPPPQMRDLRDLLRHRIALTQLRTALESCARAAGQARYPTRPE